MAQNLLKFRNEADYRTAKRNNLIVPNVCYIEDSGKTYINGTTATRNETEAGDIIAFDTDGNMAFIKPEAYASVSGYTPVSIVVIPASHTIDGTVVGMSLKSMSRATPSLGATTNEGLKWGTPISGEKYDTVVSIAVNDNNTPNSSMTAVKISHLPSDIFFDLKNAQNNIVDTYTKWHGDVNTYTPSPYLKNGSRALRYFTTDITNALCELSGVDNTDNNDVGTNTAVHLCRQFNVARYKGVGEWYLPSLSELGYMMVRLGRIKYALDVLAEVENGSVATFAEGAYWSSTISTEDKVWCLNAGDGQLIADDGENENYVRAFARF